MRKIEVGMTALEAMFESLDKATSVIDLVRQQLQASHESGNGAVLRKDLVATPYQLATLLEMVDNILMDRRNWLHDMMGVVEQ